MSVAGVEAIHIATVLEDCVDQLAVLGRIMPVSFDGRFDSDDMVDEDFHNIVTNQKELEAQYESVVHKKDSLHGNSKSTQDKRGAVHKEMQTAGADLKNNTHVFARSLKQSPLTPDNLEKVQKDRAFLQRVLRDTLSEISQRRTYDKLQEAVRSEKMKKSSLQETILKEEHGRKQVRALQKQLQDIKREKETDLQDRNEMIAHLKDQLQEMKAKTNMEGKYIKKCTEVSMAQTEKRCILTEQELKEQAEELQQKIDEETRVNTEMESYLRAHQAELEQKMDFWMEKYDKDVEKMQHELDELKASKSKDLQRLQELTKLYSEYEQVVVEDRIEKEKARRKAEMEAEELRAAVRLQAWFRGVMVRKGLGPNNKKKKKKGKKGKGKKKKKK